MKIPNTINDATFHEMVTDHAKDISARHGYKFASTYELRGALNVKFSNLNKALDRGKGKITSGVLMSLVDLVVVCLRGARSYAFNQKKENQS